MALIQYATSGISQRTTVYAEREMLKWAAPVMVLEKFGKAVMMPKNKSDTIKFRRPNPFSAQTVPLAEGVTPTPGAFTYTDVTATLTQYGQVVSLTDKVEDLHEDPVLNDMVKQLGENLGRTIEALNYGVLQAATNVFFANGSVRTSVNTPISLAKQRAVTRALKAQKAEKMREVLASSPNYATRAIEAAYIAVAHTDMENDIRALPGFIPCAQYGSRQMICPEEIGSVEDVRYVLSPDLDPILAGGAAVGSSGMISAGATSVDIYPVLYFGREAWAHIALRGAGSAEVSIIPVGQKTKDDPLGQRGFAGWKTWWAAVILNQNWMASLECGATDL